MRRTAVRRISSKHRRRRRTANPFGRSVQVIGRWGRKFSRAARLGGRATALAKRWWRDICHVERNGALERRVDGAWRVGILTAESRLRRAATAFWRLGALLALGAACVPASAAPGFESPAVIARAASDYVRAQAQSDMPRAEIGVRAAAPDPRLRLPSCRQPLRMSTPSGARRAGNTVVRVSCAGERPWKLYVPVTVTVRLQVLVAARPLARGTRVTADAVRARLRDVARLPYGYYTRRSEVAGQVLRRNLAAGEALTPGVLRPPLLVRRGQVVTLIAGAAGFSVRSRGTALEGGARGALVRVRNQRSKRVVQGTVVGAGEVRVDG